MDLRKLTATAKQFARRNPEKVDQALDRAGDFVDRRTGRKYERHVNTVQQKARQFLGGGRTRGGTERAPGDGGPTGGTPGEGPDGTPGTGRPHRDPRG